MAACGIGYVDVLVALGGYQVKPPLPQTPGQEIAGTVSAIGRGVTGLAVGDRVLAAAQGGFAEVAVAPRDSVFGIPDGLAFAAAASLRINYLTALHGLRDRAGLQKGERLLVLGAAGGVGIAAVQVGKLLGAEVIAVASTEEKRAREARGRRPGSRQHRRGLARAAEGSLQRRRAGRDLRSAVRAIVRAGVPLARLARAASRRRLRRRRDPAAARQPPADEGSGPGRRRRPAVRAVRTGEGGCFVEELIAWAGEGRFDPVVGRRFAFGDFAEAMEPARSGRGVGKTMLEIA